MATVKERRRKDGTVLFQVQWKQGGRKGTWESEPFADEPSALHFKGLVDAHGQEWPHGWVPGKGFVEPEPAGPDDVPLVEWAHRVVDKLTGIEARTRQDYRRDIDRHLALIRHTAPDGRVMEATVAGVVADDIADWIHAQEAGQRSSKDPAKWARRPASPKSIANRHGLLYSILHAATEATPALRLDNPCSKTRLPRTDDGIEDDMVFLETDEYAAIRAQMGDTEARDLADFLVATGLRWSEATALQLRDLTLTSDHPTLRVHRAWKRQTDNTTKLGAPKSRKSRRTIVLAPQTVAIIRRRITRLKLQPGDFVFTTAWGNAWRHSNYLNRKWKPAVAAAIERGLTKRPRIHDLRHSHVAWLIHARVPLPGIQDRLGHESIVTTIDRYGHLVRGLDAEVSAAVEAAMAAVATGSRPQLRPLPAAAA